MNPLDLRGPAFLVFYFLAGVVVYIAMRFAIRAREGDWAAPALNLTDPYEIAMLRGGEREARKLAVVSLVDRGLLKVSGFTLMLAPETSLETVRRPLEKALLETFAKARPPDAIFKDAKVSAACEAYKEALAEKRLLGNGPSDPGRTFEFLTAIIVIEGLAFAKMAVALSRGRHNIAFLAVGAVIAFLALNRERLRARTGLGDCILEDMRTLFGNLRERANALRGGGETNEAMMLAAVFGTGILPEKEFKAAKKVFPDYGYNGPAGWGNGSDSSCSSTSCSSSSSSCSSSSSSCGGGGGGCGGCGGGGGD